MRIADIVKKYPLPAASVNAMVGARQLRRWSLAGLCVVGHARWCFVVPSCNGRPLASC